MRIIYSMALTGIILFSSSVHAEDSTPADSPSTPADNSFVATLSSAWSNAAQEVLINAISLTGVKYKFGGNSPETGFDCSGFVRYVFKQAANVSLPHGARAISQLGQSIPIDQLQPGDLVFYNTLKSTFSHVGIYIGDNRFIHAPNAGDSVRIVDMKDQYWAKRFSGARRLEPQVAQTRSKSEASAE
jgi:cell wall-associated NlpC family hydrolase